jgi:8-oxo-dGTP diphosphatase
MKERVPVLAAGGIVVRDSARPLIGVVRLAKEKAWVLPKGKLKPGESALSAAKREVEEETGHQVTVLGFLGSMSQIADGKHKIVQFWHMHASGTPVRPLMRDIKAVKWLPLRQAIDKLSRPHEKAFLQHVGPAALQAAAQARLQPRAEAGEVEDHTIFGTIRAWLRRMGKPAIQG